MPIKIDCSLLQKPIHGVITHYSIKKWGYIQGDDGEEYFFHWRDFPHRIDVRCICEGERVEFSPGINPKRGTQVAHFCHLLDASKILSYAIPDGVFVSASLDVYDWDILELGYTKLTMQSDISMSDALQKLKDLAQSFGANALLDLSEKNYFDNEAVQYCITATPAVLGAKDIHGDFKLEELKVLNMMIDFNKRSLINE